VYIRPRLNSLPLATFGTTTPKPPAPRASWTWRRNCSGRARQSTPVLSSSGPCWP